jgi:hypothetical protein
MRRLALRSGDPRLYEIDECLRQSFSAGIFYYLASKIMAPKP